MSIEIYISIITLKVNELNSSTKRYRLDEWIPKQDPYICSLQETHFRPRDTYRLKASQYSTVCHVVFLKTVVSLYNYWELLPC